MFLGGSRIYNGDFEKSSEATLKEMDALAAREYHRSGIRESIVIHRKLEAEKEKAKMTFDLAQMVVQVKAGKQCRRKTWPEGKVVYMQNTTFRTMYLGKSSIYHGTQDFLSTDWEIAVELVDFAAALEHVRQGGKVRSKGWQDPRTYIARHSPTSNEIWVHFPAGTRQEWRPYCYDFLHNDWIKIDTIQVPAAPSASTPTKTV